MLSLNLEPLWTYFFWLWYPESLKRHWKWTSKWFSLVYIMSNCGKCKALINKKVSWSNYVNRYQHFSTIESNWSESHIDSNRYLSIRPSNLSMNIISEFESIPFRISKPILSSKTHGKTRQATFHCHRGAQKFA